jgi:two-component system NtrC family sensor kinase
MPHEIAIALQERVKELTCLYGIARIAEQLEAPLDEMLHNIVELLPQAWQFPEIAHGRILLDDHAYTTPGFHQKPYTQTSDILINGMVRGRVEIVYTEQKPECDEGPFLEEERKLLDTIAREIGRIVERKEAAEEKARLQEQLIHADRLATIGQLAAGVAHELNEPLGNILGFAQLAKKCPELPLQALQDIEKIEKASLHAREVVKKLLLFSRQMPSRKSRVDINKLIKENLYFLESRCAKEGIEVMYLLETGLPEIVADPSQLNQVIVNLVVNAIQAMSDGGKLVLETWSHEDGSVMFAVEDTGIGIPEEIRDKIFLPFFTTKDMDLGTGLGLAVAHGIITAHHGAVHVKSDIGCGTRFEIILPITNEQSHERKDEHGSLS